jgi:SMI1/KNR4 family protein SUKH-1
MLRPRKSWTSVFENPARGRKADHGVQSQDDPAALPSVVNAAAANLCARIEQHWRQDASAPHREWTKRATEEEIQAFEERNSVRLPADLREYFQRLNGIDSAPGFFRFWPFSKLIPLKSPSFPTFEADHYFIFADYMMGTWYYAIYLGEDQFLQNRVILPDCPGHPVVAPGFSEFIELYLTDSAKLYGNR